jgi:hypothetical protein
LYSLATAMVKHPVCTNPVLSTVSQFSYYPKRKAGTTALGINWKHGMSKERRLLEMFLLCWQGYEIQQVDRGSGAGRLQRSASFVSICSCGNKQSTMSCSMLLLLLSWGIPIVQVLNKEVSGTVSLKSIYNTFTSCVWLSHSLPYLLLLLPPPTHTHTNTRL